VPSRCARMASVPVGTCRYWGAVTMSSIVRISDAVSRWGQRVRTGRLIGKAHTRLAALPGMEPTRDKRRNRSSACTGTHARARSTARRILILTRSSGRCWCVNVNPELLGERQPKERGELLHTSSEFEDFLLEFGRPQVRHI